jgi:hypothetical protein
VISRKCTHGGWIGIGKPHQLLGVTSKPQRATNEQNIVAARFAESHILRPEMRLQSRRTEQEWEQSSLPTWLLFDLRTTEPEYSSWERRKMRLRDFCYKLLLDHLDGTENYRQFGTEEKCEYETFVTNSCTVLRSCRRPCAARLRHIEVALSQRGAILCVPHLVVVTSTLKAT